MATATHLSHRKRSHGASAAGSRRRPLRGRQRRRHAADRRPVHPVDRARRQRPRDLPGFPGRDPRAAGDDLRRLRLPDQFRLDRDRHRRRPARRAGRDEPGRAEGECRRVARRRPDHRRRRRVHRAQPRQGRLRAEPARGRQPRQMAGRPLQHLAADARCREAVRPRQQGSAALQEHVDAGARAVDVRPRPRSRSSTGSRPSSPRRPSSPKPISPRSTPAMPMARRSRWARRSSSTISPPRRPSRASTAPSPAPRRWRSASSRAASSPA